MNYYEGHKNKEILGTVARLKVGKDDYRSRPKRPLL